jgi:hypothetical protein
LEDNFKKETPSKTFGAWTDQDHDRDGWFSIFNTEFRGSIKCGGFLDEYRSYHVLNALLLRVCFELLTVVI